MEKNTGAMNGFELSSKDCGTELRFVMTPELRGVFDVVLYGRGPLLDGAKGLPMEIARRMERQLDGRMLVAPWQVHKTAIVDALPIWALPCRPKADGVHVDPSHPSARGVAASVRFADCTPVFVASAYPRPWAIALHSGYPGTVLDIFARSLDYARAKYGALDAKKIFVWLGPVIRRCCYNRKLSDPSTRGALDGWRAERFSVEGDMAYLDVPGAIADSAARAGIPDGNVFDCGLCTHCRRDLFYSYRAGDGEDRMLLLLTVKR